MQQDLLAGDLAKQSESFSPRHYHHPDEDVEDERMETCHEEDEEEAEKTRAEEELKTPSSKVKVNFFVAYTKCLICVVGLFSWAYRFFAAN